ncbi:unnamed protein product, partial [Mycena citricolor]
ARTIGFTVLTLITQPTLRFHRDLDYFVKSQISKSRLSSDAGRRLISPSVCAHPISHVISFSSRSSIQSVFYAIFDVVHGPKIVYQVPEGLITVSSPASATAAANLPSSPTTPVTDQFNASQHLPSRASSSIVSPNSLSVYSPSKRPISSIRPLFHFDDISKFVIPKNQLHGRLITCSTRKHSIIGFPVQLSGAKYKYDASIVAILFDVTFPPVVRKISRVLTACEEESEFLSSPVTAPAMHAILEQLYEDLNSYAETSIPIDRFNSIELKIFPFYPNPPPVEDWMVPLALLNLNKKIEDNWDLTMIKANGVNHVSRIAYLADCDISLTRLAISHLLYYQVIMMIDIFQYSNMYTLSKNIEALAVEKDVQDECGPYVTRPGGSSIPEWPKLLHLYSRLKPGKTVTQWMQIYEIHKLGIDARRFTSFGVIKVRIVDQDMSSSLSSDLQGFLRRVHRWPVLLPDTRPSDVSQAANEDTATSTELSPAQSLLVSQHQSLSPDSNIPSTLTPRPPPPIATQTGRSRRASAAEKSLEQVRTRDLHKVGSSPKLAWAQLPSEIEPKTPPSPGKTPTAGRSESRRPSVSALPANPPPSPILGKLTIPTRDRESGAECPKDLPLLLDGDHHTDELGVKYEAGWPLLEQWLAAVGGGTGPGDFGRVVIIYR